MRAAALTLGWTICAAVACATGTLIAADGGSAGGTGTMPSATSEQPLTFEPRYSHLHASGKGEARVTWLLLTAEDPGTLAWGKKLPNADALLTWCTGQKAAFVLVELDAKGKAELVTHCSADGAQAVSMISVINGLPSVVVETQVNDGTQFKGRVTGGSGSCGDMVYCEKTMDYVFDARFPR